MNTTAKADIQFDFANINTCPYCQDCGCPTTTTTTATTIAPTTSKPASSACRFEHPEKGVIDFSFIGRTDEKAAYSDESTRTTSNFSGFSFYFLL